MKEESPLYHVKKELLLSEEIFDVIIMNDLLFEQVCT
jgi:hypothetical protein